MPVVVGGAGSSTGATVQFVDSISATPVVRFDFNDLSPSMTSTIEVSPPSLRRATSDTFLADGQRINADAYDNRQIVIDFDMQSDTNDLSAAALSALAVELNRPNNILMVTIGSHPTFFRTYRSSDLKIAMASYDLTYLQNGLTLIAEPFGLGLPINIVPLTQVSNDPAIGGRFLDVNGVIGDVETPLLMAFQPQHMPWGSIYVGVRRRGTPSGLTTHMQGEAAVAYGPDTAVGVSHSTSMSGTGNNYAYCTFATTTSMVGRADFLVPAGSSPEARGAYRVFAHVQATAAGVTMRSVYNGIVGNAAVTVPVAGVYPTLVDLGVINVPNGTDPVVQGYSNTEMSVAPATLEIQAALASGSADLYIDYVYLLPADDVYTNVAWDPTVTTTFGVIDGTTDTVYQILDPTADPWVVSPSAHVFAGGDTPMISPGTNRVYILGNLSATAGDDVQSWLNVWAWYWPRYLTLATA